MIRSIDGRCAAENLKAVLVANGTVPLGEWIGPLNVRFDPHPDDHRLLVMRVERPDIIRGDC